MEKYRIDIAVKIKKVINKMNRKRLIKLIWSIIRFVLVVGLSFIIVYPLIVKFTTSIKSASDMFDPTVIFIAKHPTFHNYKTIFDAIDFPYVFIFTMVFTMINSILQMASCLLAAYGLARFKFKFNNIVLFFVILTLLIPPQALLLPLYFRFRFFNLFSLFTFLGEMKGMDLTGTFIPFTLLSMTAMGFKNGLYIYIFRQYFKNIPYTLEEAASIDGCGQLKTFYKIMLPGAKPMIITVFLFSFVWQWNDVFYAQSLGPNLDLITNKLFDLKFSSLGAFSDIYNAMLQTPKFFILVTPLIILYIFTQRFFTESIEKSGIVG